MPWNSCLFWKIHMPLTDTFMTHVLAFSGKEAKGLGGRDRRSLQRCRRPAARRFWRASSRGGHSLLLVLPRQGQLYPGKGTWGTADP